MTDPQPQPQPHKFNPANAQRLLSAERRQIIDPDAVVARLGIKPGDVLADLGCGPGFFTFPLAHAAAPGAVWGLDLQPEMLEILRERAAHEHVANIRIGRTHEVGIAADDASFDGVFCAFVLHEAARQPQFLAEVRRTLKPGGWFCVVEWHKKDTGMGPPLADRLSLDDTRALLTAAGFAERDSWEISERQYAVVCG